jgi:hypothetical protein
MSPLCYGNKYDGDAAECTLCLMSSACADAVLTTKMKGQTSMAQVLKIKMPPGTPVAAPKPVAPKPVAVPVAVPVAAPKPVTAAPVVEEAVVDAETAASDYAEVSLDALKAMAAERGLDASGNKTALIKLLLSSDAEAAGPVVEAAAKKEPNKVVAPAEVFTALLEWLQAGQALVFTRLSTNKWSVVQGTAAQAKKASGMRGDAFWKTVLSPEYYAWFYDNAGDGKAWKDHTKDEKYAFAQANGVEWAKNTDERLDLMSMTESVQIHLGFLKYKPEFQKPSQRAALKGA